MALALGLAAGVRADGATVTRATLPSFWSSEVFAATCDEIQVINNNHRKETFHCTFDAAVPPPVVCDSSVGCFWFSDFDGAAATSMHAVVTPSGLLVGWAEY